MVIDSSAILAILFGEPESSSLLERIQRDPRRLVSVASLLEVDMVLSSQRGPEASADLDAFARRIQLQTVPFDEQQLSLARDAFRRYGKGRSPARLNFGDCIAYALAKQTGEPLLFKGDDFSQTDLAVG